MKQYSFMEEAANWANIGKDAITTLQKSNAAKGIKYGALAGAGANVARNVNEPSVALSLSLDNVRFKIYLLDTGLLVNLALDDGTYFDNDYYKKIMTDKLHINEGMFIENIVAQCLKNNNHKIRYHVKVDKKKKQTIREIDFLIRNKNKIVPIEVKSSDNFSNKSLINFMKTYSNKIEKGIVLCESDLKIENNIIYLPYFMASIL